MALYQVSYLCLYLKGLIKEKEPLMIRLLEHTRYTSLYYHRRLLYYFIFTIILKPNGVLYICQKLKKLSENQNWVTAGLGSRRKECRRNIS